MESTFSRYILRTKTPKHRSKRVKIIQKMEMGGNFFNDNDQKMIESAFI